MRRTILALIASLLLAWPAHALDPDEKLADPALEARARKLSAELRCVVCQNQSIDDSSAPIAKDLRRLVRSQLSEGRSDTEVMAHIVARYGEFVLLRPRLTPSTVILWLAPLVLLLATTAALYRRVRRPQPTTEPPPLTEDERRRLDALLKDGSR